MSGAGCCRACRDAGFPPCPERAELESDAEALAAHFSDPVLKRPHMLSCHTLREFVDFNAESLTDTL